MQKPTIYEIKRETAKTSPYFFSRDTLRFFNQTMRSFKVVKSPTNRIFIYAPVKGENGEVRFYTFREYANGKLKGNLQPIHNTIGPIYSYIQEN